MKTLQTASPLKTIFGLGILLLAHRAFANSSCYEGKHIKLFCSDLKQTEIQRIGQRYDVITEELLGDLKTLKSPNPIRLQISQKGKHAEYELSKSGIRDVLEFPYIYTNRNGRTLTPVQSEAIYAHELGHSVFLRNISDFSQVHGDDFKLWSQYFNSHNGRMRASAIFYLLWDLKSGRRDYAPYGLSPDEERKLRKHFSKFSQSKRDEIQKRIAPVIKQHGLNESTFEHVLKTSLPHNEFFADLFAVTWKNDPDLIFNVLKKSSGRPDPNDYALTRSFSPATSPTVKWPNLKWGFGRDSLVPHETFAPLRQYCWKNFLSQPWAQLNRGKIIEATLRAIARDLDATVEKSEFVDGVQRAKTFTDPTTGNPLTGRQMNLSLARYLDEEYLRIAPPGTTVQVPIEFFTGRE